MISLLLNLPTVSTRCSVSGPVLLLLILTSLNSGLVLFLIGKMASGTTSAMSQQNIFSFFLSFVGGFGFQGTFQATWIRTSYVLCAGTKPPATTIAALRAKVAR